MEEHASGAPRGRGAHVTSTLFVAALGECKCGCGRPKSITVIIGNEVHCLLGPGAADSLIDHLGTVREALWGPRGEGEPEGGGST